LTPTKPAHFIMWNKKGRISLIFQFFQRIPPFFPY